MQSWEQDGSQRTDFPDGSSMSLTPSPDPRWGLLGPVAGSFQRSTPAGLSQQVSTQRTVLLANPNDPLALDSIVDTITVNGRDFLRTYEAANRRFTLRTPEGRERLLEVDEKGRPATVQIAGLEPIDFGYDDLGRLITMAQGTGEERRLVSFEYNAKGWLERTSAPLSQSVHFEHDNAGQISSEIYSDGRTVSFSYDPNGNLTSVIPSGKPLHRFDFTPVDLPASYAPPTLGTEVVGTTYSYNLDQQLTRVSRPDSRAIDLSYDGGGRLSTVGFSEGMLQLSYDQGTGRLVSVSSPGPEKIDYSYDGFLMTGATWSGLVPGAVARAYDNNFHLVSLSVNGADPIGFQYDRDGLLVQAGSLTLERDTANGLLTGTTLGAVETTQSYKGFGELGEFQASFGSTPLYAASYTYDKLGRITEKAETLGNVNAMLSYQYDSAGRLADVLKDGGSIEHYGYGENGNRTSESRPTGEVLSTYDAQDRLLQHGDVTYTYSSNGEPAAKTQGGVSVTYSYDELGNLRRVVLSSGVLIEYVIDGQSRRVGKKVNGTLVQAFLYDNRLSLPGGRVGWRGPGGRSLCVRKPAECAGLPGEGWCDLPDRIRPSGQSPADRELGNW